MDQQSWLNERFEENRPRLRGMAYRMLGSLSEAEDAVQEAWLRLDRTDAATVENLGGWLTTVVSRVCLDMLRSRKSRREEPLGAQVAEPSIEHGEGADPEGEAVLAGRFAAEGRRGWAWFYGAAIPMAFAALTVVGFAAGGNPSALAFLATPWIWVTALAVHLCRREEKRRIGVSAGWGTRGRPAAGTASS